MMLMMQIPEIKNHECVDQITQRLLRFRGVDHLIIDVNSKTVRMIYDRNRTNPNAIRNALREIGYTAE
ncbi:heavy-metal-associated domain-containing protein [Thermoproteota archaeon]